MEPARAEDQDAPTQELVSAPVGDRCASCQSPLASDQRYCVSCGERRGKARFSFDALAPKPAEAAPRPQRHHRRPTVSSGFALILGIATLLLAMGVGVLIGHDSNTKTTPVASAGTQKIVVQGLGGSSGSSNASTAPVSKNSFKATKVPKLTTKVVKKVQAAAAKVLGSQANLSKNVTQQVGGSCSGGAGCQGGKFTGNYFGQ
jgi:hypothetical protein